MEIRMESTDGALVGSPSESIRHFERQTRIRQREWGKRLANEPDAFSEIEQEIDQHLLELERIGDDQRQILSQLEPHLHGLESALDLHQLD